MRHHRPVPFERGGERDRSGAVDRHIVGVRRLAILDAEPLGLVRPGVQRHGERIGPLARLQDEVFRARIRELSPTGSQPALKDRESARETFPDRSSARAFTAYV